MGIVPAPILIAALVRLLVVALMGLVWWPSYAFGITAELSTGDRRVVAAIWMVALQSAGALLFVALHLYTLGTVALLAVIPWVIRQVRRVLGRPQSAYALSPTAEAFALGLEHLERPLHEWQVLCGRGIRSRAGKLRTALQALTMTERWFWGLSLGMAVALILARWSYPWLPPGSLNPAYLTTVSRYDALAANHFPAATVWGSGLYLQLLAWNLLPGISPAVLAALVPLGTALLTLFSILYVVRSTSRSTTTALLAALFYVGLTTSVVKMHGALPSAATAVDGQMTLTLLWSLWAFYFTRLAFARALWIDRLTVGVVVLVATLTGPLPAAAVVALIVALWLAHLGAPTAGADAGWVLALYVPGALLLAVLPPVLAYVGGLPAIPAAALSSAESSHPLSVWGFGLISLATMAALVVRLWAVSFTGHAERHAETVAALLFLAGATAALATLSQTWPVWVTAELIAVTALFSPASLTATQEPSSRPLHWSMGLLAAVVLGAIFYGLSPSKPPAQAARPLSETLAAYMQIEATYPRFTWAAVGSRLPLMSAGLAVTYPPAYWATEAATEHAKFVIHHRTLRLPRVFLFVRYARQPSRLSLADDQLLGWYRLWRKQGGDSRVFYRGQRLTVYELYASGTPGNPIP